MQMTFSLASDDNLICIKDINSFAKRDSLVTMTQDEGNLARQVISFFSKTIYALDTAEQTT